MSDSLIGIQYAGSGNLVLHFIRLIIASKATRIVISIGGHKKHAKSFVFENCIFVMFTHSALPAKKKKSYALVRPKKSLRTADEGEGRMPLA